MQSSRKPKRWNQSHRQVQTVATQHPRAARIAELHLQKTIFSVAPQFTEELRLQNRLRGGVARFEEIAYHARDLRAAFLPSE